MKEIPLNPQHLSFSRLVEIQQSGLTSFSDLFIAFIYSTMFGIKLSGEQLVKSVIITVHDLATHCHVAPFTLPSLYEAL